MTDSADIRCDVAVVGGGLVGTATAMALAERGTKAVVLEAEDRLGAHQSGHNSGVIHSGLYYEPGSLKARLCVEGARALYQLCEEEGVAHERCGKLVIVTEKEELPRLDELERRGHANGLTGLRRLRAEEIPEVEPHARGIAALHLPSTGIVDYKGVVEAYGRRIQAKGGQVLTGTRVTGVRTNGTGLVVETTRGAVSAKRLVNCAGLQSDRVARLCGARPDVRIVPFRGEYYEVVPGKRDLVRGLIYPVPDPRFPFLGVHLTKMIKGGVEAGPNAVLALKREGYRWTDVSLRDTLEVAGWPGTWALAARFWKIGAYEVWRSLMKSAFVRDLQRLVPAIRPEDVYRAGAGVRAQAMERSGALVDDFRIVESPNAVHVLNAPSPGATASIAIGRRIAEMASAR